MNKKRRVTLQQATQYLELAEGVIQTALDQEQDCLDNTPENLTDSLRCEKMEEAIDKLEEAIENIDNAKTCIDDASI